MNRILAADIGGTHIRTAIVDEAGAIDNRQRIRAEISRPDLTSDEIATMLAELLRQAIDERTDAVGLGFPGFFRGDTGIIATSPNIPALHDFPLTRTMTEALGLPVYAQNDGLCAALGEHRFGAGKGSPNLLHITLGTGIGGGLVLNGAPYFGENGMALEFGHLCVDASSQARSCGCGNRGCVEAYASATAVVRRYSELAGEQIDAREIHARASQGDQSAATALGEAGRYLGMAIAEAIKLLDLSMVSISGGLTGAWEMLYPPMMATLDAGLLPPQRGNVALLRSALGDDAGLLGAASLPGLRG